MQLNVEVLDPSCHIYMYEHGHAVRMCPLIPIGVISSQSYTYPTEDGPCDSCPDNRILRDGEEIASTLNSIRLFWSDSSGKGPYSRFLYLPNLNHISIKLYTTEVVRM